LGELFDCAWFNFTGQVPSEAAGQNLVLLLDVNGEMCIFDEAGVPVRELQANPRSSTNPSVYPENASFRSPARLEG